MGAGYSGLRQITTLRPSYLKLDRSLITDIDADPARAPPVSALLGYARQTQSYVVAEGVETKAEFETLRALGVELVQGYYVNDVSAETSIAGTEGDRVVAAIALVFASVDPEPLTCQIRTSPSGGAAGLRPAHQGHEVIDTYRRAGDHVRRGDALIRRARLLSCIGRLPEASQDVRESVRVLELAVPGPELARAYSLLASTATDLEPEAVTVLCERAIELAQRLRATGALVYALNTSATIRMAGGDERGRAELEHSLTLAVQNDLPTDAGRAFINLAGCLGGASRWTDAMDVIESGIEYCRDRGLEAWTKSLLGLRAEAELALGRWDAAAETAGAILAAPRVQSLTPRVEAPVVLALVRARRGDPGYRPLLDEARQLVYDSGELEVLALVAVARAEAAWLEGRSEAIAEETAEALTLAERVGDGAIAGALSVWRRRGGLPAEVPPGALEHHRLLLSGGWAQAARVLRVLSCPYDAALALADSGEPEALRDAHDEFRRMGARAAEAIVARRLRELGERGIPRGPRARTRANAAGLTSRELEVLPLLAAGLRNAEIADRLIVSPKTVDHHGSSILRKLDAKTRGQAGAAAARLGLTQTNSTDEGVAAQ